VGLGAVWMGPENLALTGVQPRTIQSSASNYKIPDALFFSRKQNFKVNVKKYVNVGTLILTKRRLAVYISM
jgi:hypothetical protein